jgi:hypothetical protein
MDAELSKRWRTTEVLLERACSALPSPTPQGRVEFEAAVKEFRDYLSHNELELALDALCAAADLVIAPGRVWRDLARAAETMGLQDRLPKLRRKFLDAASRVLSSTSAGGKDADG